MNFSPAGSFCSFLSLCLEFVWYFHFQCLVVIVMSGTFPCRSMKEHSPDKIFGLERWEGISDQGRFLVPSIPQEGRAGGWGGRERSTEGQGGWVIVR